jgi:hypothetical protein
VKSARSYGVYIILIILCAAGYQIFFLPLPKSALYFITDHTAEWILNEGHGADSAPKRFVNLWIEQSVLAHIYDAQKIPDTIGDADRIARRLTYLRPMLVSQIEVRHKEVTSSTMLAGLGKCSGLNTVAASLLSRDFDRVEMIDVDGDQADSGHSFGRAWSAQDKAWIYFDIWTPQIQVFRVDQNKAEYTHRINPAYPMDPGVDVDGAMGMHDRANLGHVQVRLQPSFGGYLLYRLRNYINHGSTWEKGADLRPSGLSIGVRYSKPLGQNYTLLPRTYVKARLEHMLGNAAGARRDYTTVAASRGAGTSSFGLAAAALSAQVSQK